MAKAFEQSAEFQRAYADLQRGALAESLAALAAAGGQEEAARRVGHAAARSRASDLDKRRLAYDVGVIRSIQELLGQQPLSTRPTARQIAAALDDIRRLGNRFQAEGPPHGQTGAMPGNVHVRNSPASTTVLVDLDDGTQRSFSRTHPLVSGEMVQVQSSNVFAIGYDLAAHFLYVRYLDDHGKGERSGPGPIYRYFSRKVEPTQFLKFLAAGSKGGWVWDNLRVRGSRVAHQGQYELVGTSRGYVPRQATYLGPAPGGGSLVGYLKRKVMSDQGRVLTSSRPDQTWLEGRPRSMRV